MDDKLKHKLVTHSIANFGGYAIYKVTNNETLAIAGGFASAILIGILKENYDAKHRGEFSNEDMIANVNGAAIGTLCLVVMIDLNKIKRNKREQLINLY